MKTVVIFFLLFAILAAESKVFKRRMTFQETAQILIERCDTDKSGTLSLSEMLAELRKYSLWKDDTEEDLKRSFDDADQNDDGEISVQEMTLYLESL